MNETDNKLERGVRGRKSVFVRERACAGEKVEQVSKSERERIERG